MFFYILTLSGRWNREPTYQVTIMGPVDSAGRTREEVFLSLHRLAEKKWHEKYRGISTNGFTVIHFSLEPDELVVSEPR